MKKVSICSFLFCFLISCSTDSDIDISDKQQIAGLENDYKRNLPGNNANPFDNFGRQYHDALTSYQQQNQKLTLTEELREHIKFISEDLENRIVTSKRIIESKDIQLQSIVTDPLVCINNLIYKSPLEDPAKISLINFFQELISQKQGKFSKYYDFIVSYENKVLKNTKIVEHDRKILLSVTSIARYSLYSDLNRKDRDWEKSAGNHAIGSSYKPDQLSIITIICFTEKILYN